MKNLYNPEKVLWLATQPKGLHVSPMEATNFTDLDGLVGDLVNEGHLVKVASDDSGTYYESTLSGKINLYQLKIEWRHQRGKSVDEEEVILAGLLAQQANPSPA